ncbi:hypothetical protein CCACVL1_21175 [Corchorus capsularis]|uniref:BHLH domain-containing protein n=1 Tax=Corchorus capsularis TaxID=210143 RepID=A0A1R3H7R9_COCAP|nr:hypothetical protein CCACVL1_21175 [Corchorus capsularis]
MGTTALRQLLKSFCSNSPWNYAVLWKLRLWGPMSLTWEDGYPRPGESVESISSDAFFNSEIISSHFETNIDDVCFGGYPVTLVVANMSHLEYAWGEGVVGEVAYAGKHCWVCSDDIFTGKANSKLVPECPAEWLPHFASGIKTIVLVPVLPHGVLQLGSLEMVSEDLSIISYIKERFACKDIHAQLPSSLMSGLLEKLEESSSASISPLNSEDSNDVDSIKHNELSIDQIVPLSSIQDAFQAPGIDLLEVVESENKISIQPVSLNEASSPLSQSINSNQLAIGERELMGLYSLKEESQTYPECNGYPVGECGEILDGLIYPYPASDFLDLPLGDYNFDDASFLDFHEDCELLNALGSGFQRQGNEYLWESSFLNEDVLRDLFDGIEPSLSTEGGDEYLLQAVVGQVYDESVDIANRSNHFMTSKGQVPLSSRPQSMRGNPISVSQVTSAFVGEPKHTSSSKTTASFQSTVSTITDNKKMGKDGYYTQSKKGLKQSSVTKKRARPGDNPKPRPRDRQMIQDRLKELRELVPNGPKYSIDALLDETVKHMMYLRSVTNQAEKLKQWVHREVSGRKNIRSSQTKDGHQIGTSWAYEIGDQLKLCPIVVEDLAVPGHLLIEMLCNDHGMFLEIAQVIRSFNLTILKGVMESCSNNTWAHFIVEASRGFHRLDIFWPLMQLLQRQRNPTSSKI